MARPSKKHKADCKMIAENTVVGNEIESWMEKVDQYIENPFFEGDEDYVDGTMSIASEHGVSTQLAAILFNSKNDNIPQDSDEV